MTSGKQARRQRQATARPLVRSTEGRRASPKVLGIGLAIVVAIALAVVLAVVLTNGSSGNSSATGSTLPDSDVIAQQLGGIPQQGNALGKASAPVTMVEYIDLQCPICREFETSVMPDVISKYVRLGKLKVEARVLQFIGPDSLKARNAMLAAAEQNKAYDFSQVLYANQGTENTGWVTDDMIAQIAASVPGMKVHELLDAQSSSAVKELGTKFDTQAKADKVPGTPTLYVGKSGTKGQVVNLQSATDEQTLTAAIDDALG